LSGSLDIFTRPLSALVHSRLPNSMPVPAIVRNAPLAAKMVRRGDCSDAAN